MKIEEYYNKMLELIQVGKTVEIQAEDGIYMNCGGKTRWLKNLEVTEILPGSFKFIQHVKKDKNFWINKEDIKFVRVVK